MQFPDHTFCTLTINYKSGANHVRDTEVAVARKTAATALKRKGVRFIKVIVPDPNSRRIAVFLWTYETGWTRTNALAPESAAPHD